MAKEVNSSKEKKESKKTQTKKSSQKKQKLENTSINSTLKLEVACIMIICLSFILIIGVFFNGGGILGQVISKFLKGIFGIGAYILPIALICFSIFTFFSKEKKINIFKFSLTIIAFVTLITFFHMISKDTTVIFSSYWQYLINEYKTGHLIDGGIIGAIIGDLFIKIMGKVSSCIFLFIIFLASAILLTGKSFFAFIGDFFKKISSYFYYEYSIRDEYENELDEKDNSQIIYKKSIFSVLKEKFFEKNSKIEEEFFDEDFEITQNENANYSENLYNNKDMRILKKQKNLIYDGNDKYIKIDKPVFLNMSKEVKNEYGGNLVLATDEINKIKNEKKQIRGRNQIPEVFNLQKHQPFKASINQDSIFEKRNREEFNVTRYPFDKSKSQKIHNDNEDIFKTEKYEKELLKNSNETHNENIFESKENLEKNQNIIWTKENCSNYRNLQMSYTIDFDVPSIKEIEELFSILPEENLSEDIDFPHLDKLNEFYDFEANVDFEEDEIFNINDVNSLKTNQNIEEIAEEDINVSKFYDEIYNDLQEDEYIPIIQNSQKSTNINKDISKQNTLKKENNNFANVNEPIIIRAEKEKILSKPIIEEKMEYQFPKLNFLNKNHHIKNQENDMELRENSTILVKTLKSFNINAQVINISKGPSVTRYELAIEDGVKVSKILGLSDNIALSLAATSIRIEAPIPGKSAVGIEIPNKEITSVYLSEVICSEKFQRFPSKLSFGLGKDITGNVIVTDIAKMPHMLIAGATGSGKSVCINTLITSILYKATPDEVKLMMIDPKVVELSVYNGIPHLLAPVVTEPEKAAGVLNWAVSEMMERYNLFAQTGTRNLVGYNALKEEANEEKLPQIIIIIDELADLMMVAAKEVESAICRLAQLARAAGIHLIIATQRPSVDVITGLIKANIPSRIAFSVSSGTDSRTVIDSVGAEKLLGKGDMLFKSVDMNKPLRIQGAFISDKEVETIVSFLKQNNQVNYDENIIDKIESSAKIGNSTGDIDSDELTEEVIPFLIKKGKASTSMIQRQFRIGYNRAARIIEDLEDRGLISSENGSKQRDVLMDKYQYEEYLNRKSDYF